LKKYWIQPIDQQLATIATGRIVMQNSEEWVVCNEFSQSNYCDARLCREKHKHCMDIKSFSNSLTMVGDWMFCTNYWDPLAALNKTQMLQGESDRISRRTWIVAKTTKKSWQEYRECNPFWWILRLDSRENLHENGFHGSSVMCSQVIIIIIIIICATTHDLLIFQHATHLLPCNKDR
jgi:hypothetical protein